MGGALDRLPEPPAPGRPLYDPTDPTLLLDPQGPRNPSNPGAPTGPSAEAIEAVRRAIEARAAAKATLAGRARQEGVDPSAGSQPSRVSASPAARAGTVASQSTLNQYLRRGRLLFERYRRETGTQLAAEDSNPLEFVNWAISLKHGLSSGTWRMYRQSLYHFLDGVPSYDAPKAVALLDADAIDRSRPEAPPPPKDEEADRRTSALKEKRLPVQDFDMLTTYLGRFKRSRLAPVLVDWLRAGILTGLRPTEWKATDLEVRPDPAAAYGRRAYLYVLSAKSTNGRSTGIVRTLDLSAFPDVDLAVVRRQVERARSWLEDGRYAEMQAQVSGLMYGAVEKIWPRRRYHYTLYSTRHQAIANWKASSLSLPEIAAIVGHGVTATSAETYGKKRSSWPPSRIPAPPRPVAEELAVVRDRVRLFERRLQLEVEAGLRSPGDMPELPVG